MTDFKAILELWPRNFVRDEDVALLLPGKSDDARYGIIKRAVRAQQLLRMRRGFYLITSKTKQTLPNEFELATLMYEPSFISLESALSYHGWIPERVHTTASVTPRRAALFKTPLGHFHYSHVPEKEFYLGVDRLVSQTGIALIADPWRALADLMYTRRKDWPSLEHLDQDMRVDTESVLGSDIKFLEELTLRYPSPRVRWGLGVLQQEIKKLS